ncbi:MAG: hypothetical protein ACFFC7_11295 [Candidatus Hermodarchaeota archaeon]
MSKKERHRQDLIPLFDEFIKTTDSEIIFSYLTSNSNLPGRRANIELAQAFAEVCETYSAEEFESIETLILGLIELTPDEAPVDSPKEFLSFCGILGLGVLGSIHPSFFNESLFHLHRLAEDPRWRIREAVAMATQRLIKERGEKVLQELDTWIAKGNWLRMRAVAAGVAEPTLLNDKLLADWALELHKKIFYRVHASTDRRSEAFKTLRQGLSYTLSVIVSALPTEGFEYIYELIDMQDEDILRIIKQNLKKNRLSKNYSNEVENLSKFLK